MLRDISECVFYSKYMDEIYNQGKPTVLYFSAKWCNPCQSLTPVIDIISNDFPNVLFLKLDIENNTEIAISNNIRGVPNIMFLKNGDVVERMTSVPTEYALRNAITNLI